MAEDAFIQSLLIERAGYERAGKKDRAAQVTEELARRGYTEPVTVKDAAAGESRGRRTTKA